MTAPPTGSPCSPVFVVLTGQVHRYRRGDAEGRRQAVEYGLAPGIPAAQPDWAEHRRGHSAMYAALYPSWPWSPQCEESGVRLFR
jgi:hypothetical protein